MAKEDETPRANPAGIESLIEQIRGIAATEKYVDREPLVGELEFIEKNCARPLKTHARLGE